MNYKIFGFFALSTLLTVFTSCDALKDLNYVVSPSPLEMHGDSVAFQVSVKIPEKGIRKKIVAELLPMYGDVALDPIKISGEKIETGDKTIPFKAGGTVTYNQKVAYKSSLETAELTLTGKVYKGVIGGKEKTKEAIPSTKLADATIVTPLLVRKDYKVISDNKFEFQRIKEFSISAMINFDKAQSKVNASELKGDDIAALKEFIATSVNNPKIKIKSISINGYASPEGETKRNDSLSSDRVKASRKALEKLVKFKKDSNSIDFTTVNYSLKGLGEDYDGFKAALRASEEISKEDQDLLIRIVEINKDPESREKEIRNLAKAFKNLEKYIFPMLRRSEMVIKYTVEGYTDEELKSIAISNPDSLKVDELIQAAMVTENDDSKVLIYKAASLLDPSNTLILNNLGVAQFNLANVNEAKESFSKANTAKENQISKNNMAAVHGVEGNRASAKELLGQANGAGPEVNYNMGIINIMEGDYSKAISNLGSESSYNKGLALLLDGSVDQSVTCIDASNDKESGEGYYLKAIASARQNNIDAVISNLKMAISADGSYKAKAASDREFISFSENASFTDLTK